MKRKTLALYCFSPPVMIATCVLEVSLLLYTIARYKLTPITRLAAVLLGFLALFQLAEYNVCGGLGMNAAMWSRIGYVAITMLPPLGLHLVYRLAHKKADRIVLLGYGLGFLWAGLFAFGSRVFEGYSCGGNYVIFQLQSTIGGLYFIYYYLGLFAAIGLSILLSRGASVRVRKALFYQAAGYAAFMVPTGVTNMLYPETSLGIPSIMCGFAVLYALILALIIVPAAEHSTAPQKRRTARQRS